MHKLPSAMRCCSKHQNYETHAQSDHARLVGSVPTEQATVSIKNCYLCGSRVYLYTRRGPCPCHLLAMNVGDLEQLEIGDDGQPFALRGNGEKVLLFQVECCVHPCRALQLRLEDGSGGHMGGVGDVLMRGTSARAGTVTSGSSTSSSSRAEAVSRVELETSAKAQLKQAGRVIGLVQSPGLREVKPEAVENTICAECMLACGCHSYISSNAGGPSGGNLKARSLAACSSGHDGAGSFALAAKIMARALLSLE